MTHPHEPSPPPSPAPEDASEPLPGVPFDKRVCRCRRCNRLVTAQLSVSRGAGAKCFEHLRGQGAYARLEAQGQQRLPLGEGARA